MKNDPSYVKRLCNLSEKDRRQLLDGDWDTNAQKGADYAFNTVTARLHPGAVILLHSVSSDNAEALGRIIDYARSCGYEFKPLTSL